MDHVYRGLCFSSDTNSGTYNTDFFFFFFERFILKCMKMKAVTTVFVAIDVSSHFMSLDLN